jgi:hypothetical protein
VNGKEDISEFVKLFTEIQGNPPTAPFHWREWSDEEGPEKIKKKVRSLDYFPIFAFLMHQQNPIMVKRAVYKMSSSCTH